MGCCGSKGDVSGSGYVAGFKVHSINGRECRPLFPKVTDVGSIPRIPADQLEAFRQENLDNSHITDFKSKEFAERSGTTEIARGIQYQRWNWVCENPDMHVNLLRASDYDDESIQQIFYGRPCSFKSKKLFTDLCTSLKELVPKLEKDSGWTDFNFVCTGSSVTGFSQNPTKGRVCPPTKITDYTTSDIDVVIIAKGVDAFFDEKMKEGGPLEPPGTLRFPSTSSPTASGMRYGIGGVVNKINPTDLKVVSENLYKWSSEWTKKFEHGKDESGHVNAGLQLTFAEAGQELPPWEMPLPWK